MNLDQLSKLLPQLTNPFALIGFVALAFVAFGYALLKVGVFSRLSQGQSSGVIRTALKYLLGLSIFAIISGVGYGVYRVRVDASRQGQRGPVKQQAGDCSAIVNGDNDSTSVDCNKAAGTK